MASPYLQSAQKKKRAVNLIRVAILKLKIFALCFYPSPLQINEQNNILAWQTRQQQQKLTSI